MRLPRSRFAWFVWILGTLVVAAIVAVVIVRVTGRSRLERALAALRASGGPELPPQMPEVTDGGKKTAAWFAQFGDEAAWARDELESTRSIEAFLAAHGREPEVAKYADDLGVLAKALRIGDEPPATELADLEYDRAREVRDAAQGLLKKQVAIESWDPVSRAWIRTRGLGHAELLRRAGEIAALEPFDPPPGRGGERFSIPSGPQATTVSRALVDSLPALALRGDIPSFSRVAASMLAYCRLNSRGWGVIHADMDSWGLQRVAVRLSECLQFLPERTDLRAIEDSLAALDPRSRALEAWRRERAVGNEIFVDFRGGTTEAARVLDGFGWVQREGLRLWLDHEQAGYLEILGQTIELAPRAPCELAGGLGALDAIVADLRSPHVWQVIRSIITPNVRREAQTLATLEVQRDLALLCIAAWRDRAALEARLAASRDPFTGKPYALREEDGVLVFSSPGDGGEPIEARLRLR